MIEIRKFRIEDLPRLHEIECVCFDEAVRWSWVHFGPALKKSDVWVAEFWDGLCDSSDPDHQRTIVGFIVSQKYYGQGWITSLDILPEHRRVGIGALLIAASEEHYKQMGSKKIFLEVAADNPAQTLYFKMGYRVTKFFKKYYDDGNDGLVMTKSLYLLERMNTPTVRRAMRTAFNTTPSELGRAAVAQAKIS